MFAHSTLTIFTVVLCFNTALLGSLGLYLHGQSGPRSDATNARDAT